MQILCVNPTLLFLKKANAGLIYTTNITDIVSVESTNNEIPSSWPASLLPSLHPLPYLITLTTDNHPQTLIALGEEHDNMASKDTLTHMEQVYLFLSHTFFYLLLFCLAVWFVVWVLHTSRNRFVEFQELKWRCHLRCLAINASHVLS